MAICGVLVATIMGAAPAHAHTASSFYGSRWTIGADISFGLDNSFPHLQTWRYRLDNAATQWNNAGGTNEPEFFRDYGYGDWDGASGDFQHPCSLSVSAIYYKELDTVGGADAAGVVFRCVPAPVSGVPITKFSLTIDVSSSSRAWYSGTPIDGDESLPSGHEDSTDLLGTVVHELGHATGWAGHLDYNDAACAWPTNAALLDYHTMCQLTFIGWGVARTLEAHDIHTFTNAY